MMRLRLALLVLSAACLSLLAAAPWTAAGQRAAGDSASKWRTLTLSASPAPSDLELLELAFPRSVGRRRISAANLTTMVVGAPFGDDYVVLATPTSRPSRTPLALVLVVNRPSALLDPVSVGIRLRAQRALGMPIVRRLADPFTHPHPQSTPALCDLSLHGLATLRGSDLRALHSKGAPLSGFAPAAAVAQAYDVVCGLAHASSFESAVRQGSCRQLGTLCCPPTAICATPPAAPAPTPPAPAPPEPTPAPPEVTIPGEGCKPDPGYVCPGSFRSPSSRPAARASRPLAVGAH